MCRTRSVQKSGAVTRITTVEPRNGDDEEQRNSTRTTEEFKAQLEGFNISDTEDTNTSKEEQRLEKDIDKEINKLQHFLEETDELIEVQDYTEMKNRRETSRNDLASHANVLRGWSRVPTPRTFVGEE